MLKLVDTECIRHIHTDDKDSFYLGVISADVRSSEAGYFTKTMKCTPYIFQR